MKRINPDRPLTAAERKRRSREKKLIESKGTICKTCTINCLRCGDPAFVIDNVGDKVPHICAAARSKPKTKVCGSCNAARSERQRRAKHDGLQS